MKGLFLLAVITITLCSWTECADDFISNYRIDVPETLTMADFDLKDKGVVNYFRGSFSNVQVKGLDQLKVDTLKFNMKWKHMYVTMKLPKLEVDGRYRLKGQYLFVPFDKSNHFNYQANDCHVLAEVSWTPDSQTRFKVLNVTGLELSTTGRVRGVLSNLFSSSPFSDFANLVHSQVKNEVFIEMKREIMSQLHPFMQPNMQKIMSNLPERFMSEFTAIHFQNFIVTVQQQIKESGYDPLRMDDVTESFNQDFFRLFKVAGKLDLKNRVLHGLSTIYNSGPSSVYYDFKNNKLMLESEMGFTNLTATNDFSVNLINRDGPRGSTNLHVTSIIATIRINQSLDPESRPELAEFKVDKINGVAVDVNGMGQPWDSVVGLMVNLVSSSFKGTVGRIASGPISSVLQSEMDKLHYDYFLRNEL